MMRTAVAAISLSALLLAGCSSWWSLGSSGGDVPRVPPGATAYKCDGGKDLFVRYIEGGRSAMIVFPEREFRLDRVGAGAGARYSNGHTTLVVQGGAAQLEEGGGVPYANCKRGDG